MQAVLPPHIHRTIELLASQLLDGEPGNYRETQPALRRCLLLETQARKQTPQELAAQLGVTKSAIVQWPERTEFEVNQPATSNVRHLLEERYMRDLEHEATARACEDPDGLDPSLGQMGLMEIRESIGLDSLDETESILKRLCNAQDAESVGNGIYRLGEAHREALREGRNAVQVYDAEEYQACVGTAVEAVRRIGVAHMLTSEQLAQKGAERDRTKLDVARHPDSDEHSYFDWQTCSLHPDDLRTALHELYSRIRGFELLKRKGAQPTFVVSAAKQEVTVDATTSKIGRVSPLFGLLLALPALCSTGGQSVAGSSVANKSTRFDIIDVELNKSTLAEIDYESLLA